MLVSTLEAICSRCIELGLVRSKADFSRTLLGRFDRYMALARARDGWVPYRVGQSLIMALEAIQDHCPPVVAQEVQAAIDQAQRGTEVARMFRR